jgi:Protein of unknown function (DUF3156)
MRGLSARRAAEVLRSDIAAFERLGYRSHAADSPYSVMLAAPEGRRDLALRLRPEGRVFGGNWGLELSTAEPVLPTTSRGLTARGRGVVRMQGVRFRARGGDHAASRLAAELSADARLGDALAEVHFERLAVEPDGRPVIRHMGGSVVWLLVPPVARTTPLPAGQPEAMVRALDEFARTGARGLNAYG